MKEETNRLVDNRIKVKKVKMHDNNNNMKKNKQKMGKQ